MTLNARCSCGKELSVADDREGMVVECPSCQAPVMVPFKSPPPKASIPIDAPPTRKRRTRAEREGDDDEENRWDKRERVLKDYQRAQRHQRHGLDANLVIGSGILTFLLGAVWFALAYFLAGRVSIGAGILVALGIAQIVAGTRNSRY
ncbi:MAG: hypothetical protein KF873_14965 [Gemmataceae bacterium]|nr:hypothetical protein [Gemmataceae bacterium]